MRSYANIDNIVLVSAKGIKKQIEETLQNDSAFVEAYGGNPNMGLEHTSIGHITTKNNQFSLMENRMRDRIDHQDDKTRSRVSCFNMRSDDDLLKLRTVITYALSRNIDNIVKEFNANLKKMYTITIDVNQCIGTAVVNIGNRNLKEFPCSALAITICPSQTADRPFDLITTYPVPDKNEKRWISKKCDEEGRNFRGQNFPNPNLRTKISGEILPADVAQILESCQKFLGYIRFATASNIKNLSNIIQDALLPQDRQKIYEIFMQKQLGNGEDWVKVINALPEEDQTQKLFDIAMHRNPQVFVQAIIDDDIMVDSAHAGAISKEMAIESIKLAYDEIKKTNDITKAGTFLENTLTDLIDFGIITEEDKRGFDMLLNETQTQKELNSFMYESPQGFVQAIIDDEIMVSSSKIGAVSEEMAIEGVKLAYEEIKSISGIEEANAYLEGILTDFVDIGIITENDKNNILTSYGIEVEGGVSLLSAISDDAQFTPEETNNLLQQLGPTPQEILDTQVENTPIYEEEEFEL